MKRSNVEAFLNSLTKPTWASLFLLLVSSCSTSMRMAHLGDPSDTTLVGKVKVRVVDLHTAKNMSGFQQKPSIPEDLLKNTKSPYRIGPLDVLIVTVWEHPELTQPLGQYRNDIASGQLVDADGTIFFPYIGRFKVSGLTLPEVQSLVTDKLGKILQNPQIDIKISSFRSQRIYVSGEARNPGVIVMDDVPMTLPEALNRVGGILPSGDASRVKIIRNNKVYTLDVENLMEFGAPLDKIYLETGDQIRIPSANEQTAYVLGEVERPSAQRFINGKLSLVRALSDAGGYNNLRVNPSGVYVVRPMDTTNVTVFRLDGKSPIALALAGQFQLKPNDLIYVDQSGLSRWNYVFQLLVPMASVISSGTQSGVNIQNMRNNPW